MCVEWGRDVGEGEEGGAGGIGLSGECREWECGLLPVFRRSTEVTAACPPLMPRDHDPGWQWWWPQGDTTCPYFSNGCLGVSASLLIYKPHK